MTWKNKSNVMHFLRELRMSWNALSVITEFIKNVQDLINLIFLSLKRKKSILCANSALAILSKNMISMSLTDITLLYVRDVTNGLTKNVQI